MSTESKLNLAKNPVTFPPWVLLLAPKLSHSHGQLLCDPWPALFFPPRCHLSIVLFKYHK